MGLELTNKFSGGNFKYKTSEYSLAGNFQIETATGKLSSLSAEVFTLTPYKNVGTVNAMNGKFSLNSIPPANLDGVSDAIISLVTELEAQL